jgi:hypothetical protein
MPEHYFDLTSAGFVPGYAFSGGPGRVFFDKDTKQFLRIEPLGGVQVVAQEGRAPVEAAPQEETPVSTPEPVTEMPVEAPPTETQPAQESEPAPVEMPEVTPVAEEPTNEQSPMSAPAQEETPVQESAPIENA